MQLPYSFRRVSRSLTEDDIHSFEADYAIRLPDAYRSFLLSVNGGYPKNESYSYEGGKSFMLKRLYPLTDDVEEFFNLRSINHLNSDAPKGFLIIGASSFGDNLCIGVDESRRGKIIYIDHEERDPDEIENDDLLGVYHLADSFESFMFSLENAWAKLPDRAPGEA